MNDTKQIDALNALEEAAKERRGGKTIRLASVRVSPGSYLTAASVVTFSSALLLRAGNDSWALLVLGMAWVVVPILALTDRIAFDGQRLTRHGVLPWFLQLIWGRKQQLNLSDLETVETRAVRTLRRGGTVRYRYRHQIAGKGAEFVFASGGRNYRKMVRELFPLIHEEKMDSRSRDLRDYLVEPRSLTQRAKLSKLAPANVLDLAAADFKLRGKRSGQETDLLASLPSGDLEKARLLRRLGNELRVAGRLTEAGEAFRRALNVIPHDGWLIYDFARLLRSQASAHSDARLLSRARAALRLASIRAGGDSSLLSLIAETFVECGDASHAKRTFQQAIDRDTHSVKARFGLAEVALREGKLAHVIHHYRDAAQAAKEKALSLHARQEADYYARLNDDDEYLAAELHRIKLLQHATRLRRLAARATNVSILCALAGPYLDPGFSTIGWSFASSSLLALLFSLVAARFLSERRKPSLA